ncbi:MAG: M48 family metallopeptidase [Cyanobacteriota bacterium]
MTQVLQVDELSFAVKRSPRRHTLELIVDRGGELVIAAPTNANEVSMAAFVREKKFWLYRKLAEKEAKQQPAGGKEFISGEGFPYLGRRYRLLLVEGQEAPLKLANGRFQLRNDLVARGRETFIGWYSERARPWLQKRVRAWTPRVEVESRGIEIRDLGYRWGSCGRAGTLNFHWATILLPPSMIDYVIVHELAHLIEANHTPLFWQLVGRVLPDYAQRKTWLAEQGGAYVSL